MKSSLSILKFEELINEQERLLKHYQLTYRAKVLAGRMSEYTANKTMECLKRTIKLLKHYERNPQADLFDRNQYLNRK